MMKRITLIGLLILTAACADEQSENQAAVNDQGNENAAAIPATSPPKSGEVTEVGTDISILPPMTRPRRRMNIDQIESAMHKATDLTWVELDMTLEKAIAKYLAGEPWANHGERLFVTLSQALGKPDHINVTQEDLTISPLFVKYLNDAARQVCWLRVYIDAANSTPAEKRMLIVGVKPTDTFKTNPDGMKKAMERMLLLYLGMRPTAAELKQWQDVFETAEAEAKQPLSAWMTVCTAALTHPAFYTF